MNELLLKNLASDFEDAELAHGYMAEHLVTRLAAQIYALRKDRQWSQQELAERAGLAQEQVSKIESGNFSSLTMKTLRKFSRAFDINLRIAFEPFSDGIFDVVKLTQERLNARPRVADLDFLRKNIARTTIVIAQTGNKVITTGVAGNVASKSTSRAPQIIVNMGANNNTISENDEHSAATA